VNRFKSHNQFGKDWTAGFRPWVVIYCEYFADKKDAMHREKQLKSAAARERIHDLIKEELVYKGYITSL
jgi:putative endonuclease